MHKQKQSLPPSTESPAKPPRESPLSLSRLREAFAAMLGGEEADDSAKSRSRVSPTLEGGSLGETALRACEINPRSVTESMLFVGRPDNGPMSARELAAAMRGVSPKEIDEAVQELNAVYGADQTPYCIEQSGGGYRLVLRPEFGRMRDKFYGKVKEARLPPSAIEVLSVLAYNQPATLEQLNELRGSGCGAALSTLVRRKLVQLERSKSAREAACYSTTERFLQLFGLENLAALPRSEDLENV
ncbi:MAG TPA: SMC-Scp complex subunit ScpB [Lacipirellulaceae bacterium]|jgi:segregation and condensation protein B|nr:SMC-Scp complex subunit ScpB [Lacipirellulaceae bacterium]